MNVSQLRAKVVEEIQNIPEDKLVELLKLIHAFKLRSEPASFPRNSIMNFASCWNDLPEDTYNDLVLVTHNQRHFNRIAGLKWQDWSQS